MGESSAGQTELVKYLATDRPNKPAGFRNTRTWIYFFLPWRYSLPWDRSEIV